MQQFWTYPGEDWHSHRCHFRDAIFSSAQLVQSLSRVRLYASPWITACQASLSITNSRSSHKFMSIESVMPSSYLILCCPLSPPALNPSQHQSLFQWVNSSHEVAKILEFQFQHQSFRWIFRTVISLQSKGLSRVFSNTIVQKHQFFSVHLSL